MLNPGYVNGSLVVKFAKPLVAFIPYKVVATPWIISTLSISRSPGLKALAIGAPIWGDWLSTLSIS